MSQAELALSPAELRRRAQSFLVEAVRREDGLFPYSTVVRNGAYVHDFDHPAAVRYTINSLLGLQASARRDPGALDPGDVSALTETFLEHHLERIGNPADLGLLLVLLCEGELSTRRANELLARLGSAARSRAATRLTMQEASWMLWGACSAADAGLASGPATARALADLILGRFVDPGSGLPRHSLRRYRGDIVSFGALTYFLRGMLEFSRLSEDPRARRTFERGVDAIVGIQGERGEWPWLISVQRRVPLDVYPVFAVHQDSMSMLFLLPALESGLDVGDAIAKSFSWVLGRNELSEPMIEREPFVAYRSIERVERLPRLSRYLRASAGSIAGKAGESENGRGVRINRECRSYHLGWILYAWSGRTEVDAGISDSGDLDLPRRPLAS
jgi:hypothetical protein